MRQDAAYVADFDSTAAMVRALSRYLDGRDFPGLGMVPPVPAISHLVNRLPAPARTVGYMWGGWKEAAPRRKVPRISTEGIAAGIASAYPQRHYPAVAVGSSNGAALHLWAALGVPWLPQTFLVPVRQRVDPDRPRQSLEDGHELGLALLAANPDVQLHHMHDPVQDRLMLRRMTYFRLKRIRLGPAYESFLDACLPRGSTIYLIECTRTWPTTQVADRYVFQHGALGGATEDEMFHGGPRVAEYLERYGAEVRRWDPPAPDGDRPEAEWGFDDRLREDVERYAKRRGHRVRRVVFREPEDMSPFVADFHRWWYRQRGFVANRLLGESFMLLEPWWALRTGSVPFWMKFNSESAAAAIERYLEEAEPYDDVYVMVFAHGTEGIGLAPPERWRGIADRARRHGQLVGVDERAYPSHFGIYFRYHADLQRIPARYPMPGPLAEAELDAFIERSGDRYAVAWP